MNTTNSTILITGGGSGIGRGLAEAFHALGNQVIISGRRQSALDETTASNPGMKSAVLDIESEGSIQSFAAQMKADFPALDVVIHNAGIMRMESVTQGEVADAEAMINTNLLGPIRLTAALLPQLQAQPHAAILTVSSGLAFVPLSMTPTYNATKAALHSYTESLRYQLQDTAIQVIELIPPYVQTGLLDEQQHTDPNAMPLADYISETMRLLTDTPDAAEILVERVKPLRFAEKSGGYDEFFKHYNDAMAAALAG